MVETADGGTLFLDEIGELPLGLQAKLLRLLQDHTFMSVGSLQEKKVNIRVIAATNRDLEAMVEKKLFRQDLYYRLNVIPIKVPPLRQRKEDIFYFIQFFLDTYNKKYGFKKEIDNKAINLLCEYKWPGNLRELSNMMERLVVLTNKGSIEEEDVLSVIPGNKIAVNNIKDFTSYKEAKESFDKSYILKALDEGKTIKELAVLLDVSESTVKRKLKKYKIRHKDRVKYEL